MEIQGAPDANFFVPPYIPHIFARGPNGELLQFFHPGDRWHRVNLTDIAMRLGPGIDNVEDVLIAGDPHSNWFFPVLGSPPRVLRSQHVVARSRENKLLEYSWDDVGAYWKVVSLTDYAVIAEEDRAEVGTPVIAGDPHGYEFTFGNQYTQHVVARSPSGQLLEWYWNSRDQTWRVVSLSGRRVLIPEEEDRAEVGTPVIAGDPHGYEFTVGLGVDAQFTQHVVARSPSGQLLEWYWNSRDQTWRVVSLSGRRVLKEGPGVGRPNAWIAGNPHGLWAGRSGLGDDIRFTQHVVARSPDNRLLEWSWSSRDATWRVVSLTDRAIKQGPGVGEALIGDGPHGSGGLVAARGLPPDNRLLAWSRTREDWIVQNNFPTAVG